MKPSWRRVAAVGAANLAALLGILAVHNTAMVAGGSDSATSIYGPTPLAEGFCLVVLILASLALLRVRGAIVIPVILLWGLAATTAAHRVVSDGGRYVFRDCYFLFDVQRAPLSERADPRDFVQRRGVGIDVFPDGRAGRKVWVFAPVPFSLEPCCGWTRFSNEGRGTAI